MRHGASGITVIAVWLFAASAAPTGMGAATLTIDAASSRVVILVGKAGVLSFAGHAHEVIAPAVSGQVTLDPADWQHASVSLEFDAAAMRVTGRNEPPADVPEVQRVMSSSQVLDVARFPRISFHSRRVSATVAKAGSVDALIEGDLTLHGTTRPMGIRAAVTLDADGGVTAHGACSLKQTAFGIVPVTAAGGTVRVKDELEIQFVLKANPLHETHVAG